MLHAGVYAQGDVGGLLWAVHGLQKTVGELPGAGQGGQVQARLGPDYFEFLALLLNPGRASLGADTEPVYALGGAYRAVAFYGNAKAACVQGLNEGGVYLQQRFATRQYREPILAVACGPLGGDLVGQGLCGGKFAAQGAVGTHKVGVAKTTNGGGTVAFAACPEVATGKAAEHGGAAGLAAFALQGVENFFDAVGHGETPL